MGEKDSFRSDTTQVVGFTVDRFPILKFLEIVDKTTNDGKGSEEPVKSLF